MENKFTERLFELKQEEHLSQESVAKAIGVFQKFIDFWEKGINEPKLTYIVKLASFFNVSCDFLMGVKDDKKKTPNFQESFFI